jgi:hypothetical protein
VGNDMTLVALNDEAAYRNGPDLKLTTGWTFYH